MKKIFTPFIAVLILIVFVSGCKKDKNDSASSNKFTYNGADYNLSKGFLENYGMGSNGVYNLDLTMLSSNFTIHERGGAIDSISGTGDGLYFETYTSLPGKLDVRDYVYDANSTGANGTFDFGMLILGYNVSAETGTVFEITAGKISVTNNGSEYEISVNCTASNGKTITGYFKGSLNYYNYDKKKSLENGFLYKKRF